jgi:hypothetical protein
VKDNISFVIAVAALCATGVVAILLPAILSGRMDTHDAWIEEHDAQVARMFADMTNEINALKRQALPLRGPVPLPEPPNVDSSIHDSIVVFPGGTYIGGNVVPEPINLMKTIAGPR